MADARTAAQYADGAVRRAARDLAYDDYLAALLAPDKQQADFIAIAALMGELARIPLHVSDPALGEIRLQWWRDALAADGPSGHPVADAVRAMQPLLPLPVGDFIAPVLEARAAELYAEPFATRAAFEAYVTSPELAAMRLRAALLGFHPVTDTAIEEEAARALGLVRAAARMPYLFAKGRTPLSADQFGEGATIDEGELRSAMAHLIDEAATAWAALRPRLRRISRDLRRVIVPVALAGPYLRAIQSAGRDSVRDVAEPSPLERSLRLWLAARLGRF